MPIKYKVEVLPALKKAGYNTTRLRQDKILSESTIQKLRSGIGVSWGNLEIICDLLRCQPGDLLENIPDEQGEEVIV